MTKVYEMTTKVGKHDLQEEDSGCALIFTGDDETGNTIGDGCFFARLQSWDDSKTHTLMNSLKGKKITVTVEVE